MHAKRYGCYIHEAATLGRVVAPAVTATREGMQQGSASTHSRLQPRIFGLFIFSIRNLNEHDIRDLHSKKSIQ